MVRYADPPLTDTFFPMLAEAGKGGFEKLALAMVQDPKVEVDAKLDGERLVLVVDDGEFWGLNRKGETISLPPRLHRAMMATPIGGPGRLMLDGEWMTDGSETFWVFDLPMGGTMVSPAMPLTARRDVLTSLFKVGKMPDCVRLAPFAAADDIERKAAIVRRVVEAGGEGVIGKRADSPYTYGRSWDWVKAKRWAEVDCYVTALGIDGKANMGVSLWSPEANDWVDVGEVGALTGDGPRVRLHDVVTVRVLYATEANRLYQPGLPRIRKDKAPTECLLDQLDACRGNHAAFADWEDS